MYIERTETRFRVVEGQYLNLKDELFVKELFMFRDRENLLDEQIKWGILKYEICKFCMVFSKSLQKERKEKIHY